MQVYVILHLGSLHKICVTLYKFLNKKKLKIKNNDISISNDRRKMIYGSLDSSHQDASNGSKFMPLMLIVNELFVLLLL